MFLFSGYLDKELIRKSASLNPKSAAELRAQNYSIEDKKIELVLVAIMFNDVFA